ncbi:MAG: DNA translocase FtsK [Oscillospiraceae bacterium]|nr:DNA translocase FtsK [Oscillospiraceae bacterium]
MAAGISNVLSIVIVFILLVYTILRCMNIRVHDVIEFFIGVREEAQRQRFIREEYEYENLEDAPKVNHEPLPERTGERARVTSSAEPQQTSAQRKAEKLAKARDELVKREQASHQKELERKKRMIDIPLDGELPLPAEPEKKQAPSTQAETPLELDEAMHLEESYGYTAPKTASQPMDAVLLDTADLPKVEPDEPQPLSDEEAMEELTGLAAELVPDAPIVPEPMEEEPALSDEAPLDTQEVPLSDAPQADEPAPDPEAEPEVLDTHQLVTETVDNPVPAAEKIAYDFPPIDLLNEEVAVSSDDVSEELRMRSHKLADTLQSFGVQAQIINVIRGPSVTRYEILLDRGVKFSRLTALQDDIALALGASGVRIAAIPDKSAVGIEVPNKVVQTVYLREVLSSRAMSEAKSKLAFALGKDITGASIIGDIGKMPHMLIAGTTGSGKSVCINSIIISLLYRASPEEVRLIMVDPKMVELGNYNGIPHLLVPVVTDYKKAAGALNWAVMEMERRYKRMFELGARDLDSYNKIAEKRGEEVMPRVVIIIDELADLMMMAAKEIEESVCRIAQKARAAGMHLIIATQRPSADVLTGLMKSNIPSRIAFAVASQIESRIILDQNGAEKLIGRGDMLYCPLGIPKPLRVQGCYLSTAEVEAVTEYIKQTGEAQYSQEIIDHMERSASEDGGGIYEDDDEADDRLDEAIDIVIQTGQASASMLQRKLKLGYARAGRIIDQMESRGIIGPSDGAKPRQVLLSRTDWAEMKARRSI